MKKEDKFFKEKIDIICDTSRLDYSPPDRTEKNREITNHFSACIKSQECSVKTNNNRKKKLILGFISGVSLLLLIVVFFLPSLFSKNDEFFFNDDDLTSNQYSLIELQKNYSALLFANVKDITEVTIRIYRSDERNTNVYGEVIYNTEADERIELVIIFVDNYKWINERLYSSLAKTGQTTLFSYSYDIIESIEVSYAKFVHSGYNYYVKLNSEVPENIISILESFG